MTQRCHLVTAVILRNNRNVLRDGSSGSSTGGMEVSSSATTLLRAVPQEGVEFEVQGLFPQRRLLELQTDGMKIFHPVSAERG